MYYRECFCPSAIRRSISSALEHYSQMKTVSRTEQSLIQFRVWLLGESPYIHEHIARVLLRQANVP